MKSKTSFCNVTVLKKDITRFMPIWAIYLIIGLLMVTTLNRNIAVADSLHDLLSTGMPFIMGGYAIVVALLLFGDLFNSRMCNTLHAMPLRRQTWFCTHCISGVLMALVPNGILGLICVFLAPAQWWGAALWLGGSMLMYLFFFGLACLCCLSTGNHFAALLVYAVVNVFSLELMWLVEDLIMPFLEGVRMKADPFYLFCPLAKLTGADYFLIDLSTVSNADGSFSYTTLATFAGFGDGWTYLFILAAIGVALAVAALCLYRRRHLEVAGDFAAIAPVRWLISILGSLACGMIFRLFSPDRGLRFVFLFVGISVGFFLLQMLLQRNVKIFTGSTFLKWGALVLTSGLILVLGAVDILGIETYVPKADKVATVIVSDSFLSDSVLEKLEKADGDNMYRNYSYLKSSNAEAIQAVLEAHQLALEEHGSAVGTNRSTVTLHYILKNGQTVTRNYTLTRSDPAFSRLSSLFMGTQYYFGASDLSQLKANLDYIYLEGEEISGEIGNRLLEHLWVDAQKGLLTKSEDPDILWLELSFRTDTGRYRNTSLCIPTDSLTYQFVSEELRLYLSAPAYVFGTFINELAGDISKYNVEFSVDTDPETLLKALLADANRGDLAQPWFYHQDHRRKTIEMSWTDSSGRRQSMTVQIWEDALNSWPLVKDA